MSKVYLLYRSTGQRNDQLLSIHQSKSSAIKMKRRLSECKVRESQVNDVYDLYVVEKYVVQ